jgi:hypothetical protein
VIVERSEREDSSVSLLGVIIGRPGSVLLLKLFFWLTIISETLVVFSLFLNGSRVKLENDKIIITISADKDINL